jgi:PAS domain S-box-containing protein
MTETAEPRRVLYADGDRDRAASAVETIERLGDDLVVEMAESEREALARLSETAFDAVVTVQDLPDADGLAVLDAVRAESDDRPVLLLTSTESEAVAREALDRGVTDVLRERSDQVGLALLANRIEHAVDGRRPGEDESTADGDDGDGHDLQGAVCRVLVRAETRADLERGVCEAVADAGPYSAAWIGERDPDRGVLDTRAAGGDAPADGAALDVAGGHGTGSTRHVETLARGSRADLAVPLVGERRRHGVLCVARDGPEGLDGDERARLTEVGDDVAAALDRLAQRHHQRRNRQLRSAVEHAGHVVLITDEDGHITYVNDAFESVTGYPASEAIGCRPSILQSGEHDEAFYRDLWETIADGEVWEGEVINERRDGSRYVINQTIAPITDDGGDTTGFVAVNRDITERKERELNLAFLKRAIDQAGIGIGTYREDGFAAYVNERLADLFGVDREELRARHISALDPSLDRERFPAYWDSFDEGERRIYETEIERLDTGERLPVEVVSSRVQINGEPYQVNTVRDATEHLRQKRDLERFRSAVDHAGHSVFITDADGRIEYVNDAFEAVSGYSAAEAIGETPALLRSGEHDEAFYRELWETILDGEVWHGEVTNERKDGSHYVVDQTIAPITGDDGDITGFVAINRDVTELKAYERELEAQNERLKGYGQAVAHDLRNPLALLDAELKQFQTVVDDAETVDGEAVRAFCRTVGVTVDRMGALIDDLLAMAEHGQRVLDAERVSLADAARAAWRQVETDTAELTVGDADVDADPDRLRELFSNLFRNSVEHAGADVDVRVEPLDFTEGFAVEDDGPGIPPEERDEVFDRGFTTASEGTGFGLAIVEQIAAAHGWTVSVTEGREGGARFEFHLDEGA